MGEASLAEAVLEPEMGPGGSFQGEEGPWVGDGTVGPGPAVATAQHAQELRRKEPGGARLGSLSGGLGVGEIWAL